MANPSGKRKSNRIRASGSSAQPGAARERDQAASSEQLEECFWAIIQEPLDQAARIGEADIVVGIPFYNEADTIGAVVKTIRKGLEEFYPQQKSVIVAAGAPVGGKALEVINRLPQSDRIEQIAFLLDDERINGKGWSLRAIMAITRILDADLVIVEADLKSRTRDGAVEGLAPAWISLLLEPIRKERMDIVISGFNRYYFESPISTHLVYPLLTAIFGCPIRDLVGGEWAISHGALHSYLQDPRQPWRNDTTEHGIDTWLATRAISGGARICEANLGIKIHKPSAAKAELVLRQVVGVLFSEIEANSEWWQEAGTIGQSPLVQPLAAYGAKKAQQPDEVQVDPQPLVSKYKRGFDRFHSLYQAVLPQEACRQLEKLAETDTDLFVFPDRLWAQAVYHMSLAFAFNTTFARGDLQNSFIPLYQGRVAGFALEIQALKAKLESSVPDQAERLVSLAAERRIEDMVDEFIRQKTDFLEAWATAEEALQPPIPKVTYREFIPGVPLVVPLELATPEGTPISANAIYESILHRHTEGFEQFVHERLGVPRQASSLDIVRRIQDFMRELETEIDKLLLPGDLSTVEGTRETAEAVFRHFPHYNTFALIPGMASWLLWRHPPSNLLTKLGHRKLSTLLKEYEPADVLALATWSEEHGYIGLAWRLIEENVRPEHFEPCAMKPLVVSQEQFPSLAAMKDSAALDKITGRIVISNLHKGTGGNFPKLRYFTAIAKNIAEAERFGRVWMRFAEERKEFGEKVINSLEGHWGREPLSAHSIFENGHQQVLVARLREMARRIAEEAGKDASRLSLADHLNDMADSYHLAVTLPDGRFIPCSAWTWASYSFKGGKGLPTPLSLHVERDWSSQEFLTEYYKAAGGTDEAIEHKIVELMGQGREWEDLSPILLGGVRDAEEIVPEPEIAPEYPPARTLARFSGNPVLGPIKEHPWESKYVLNPGVIRLYGKVYLVYRAFGEDDISRLGLAISEDGFNFTERLEEPVFEPGVRSEEKGCEDPRLTLIGDRIYMVYTAYGRLVAQIALASIGVEDFLNRNWEAWERQGLMFPRFANKDGALFPEQFDGRFAMLHRVDPHIWIAFSPHLRSPWPRRRHKILAGATLGMMWDGRKIGAGAQPIKTRYGWLLITHGVDHTHVYRLGVMLLDLADPRILLYRSPNPILEPVEEYEVGEDGKSWVPNVVFTCGAVPREDNKEILEAEDEILVYYGAADSTIGVATARVADLVPEEYR